jgi:hypothetical protein
MDSSDVKRQIAVRRAAAARAAFEGFVGAEGRALARKIEAPMRAGDSDEVERIIQLARDARWDAELRHGSPDTSQDLIDHVRAHTTGVSSDEDPDEVRRQQTAFARRIFTPSLPDHRSQSRPMIYEAPVRRRGESRERRSSTRTASTRGSRGDPDDADPPLGRPPLNAKERRGLRFLIDRCRRAQLALFEDWRLCARCMREQESEEFSNGAKYCRSCERQRLVTYRQRKAVAA